MAARAIDRARGARRIVEIVRDPEASGRGILGRFLRFALAGGLVAVYYLTITTILADVIGLPFQVALAIGFSTGIALHFTLQRVFVWVSREGFALPVRHQVGRYLLVVAIQYSVTAGATATLPHPLRLSTEVVYVGVTCLFALLNFMAMRKRVFHTNGPVAAV